MFLLSTSSLAGYGLHRIFSLAKQAEFDGIDISVDFDQYDSYDAVYIDSLIASTDLPVMSITAPARRLNKKQCDQILALASELGVQLVNLHPPHRLDRERDWFGEYLQVVAKKYPNITMNIINAPPKTWLFVISEYGDARPETIKKITAHTALSIENVDPESGVDLMKTLILLGSTMGLVYLSDKDDGKVGLFPGEGTMPLESLLIKLRDIDYSGHFALTVDPKALLAGAPDTTVVACMLRSRDFLSKYFS
jgi:sugar phosphate isomerase/epimerase